MKSKTIATSLLLALGSLFYSSIASSAVDADAAQALAKKEGCLKCHGIDKPKEAKSFKEIASKLKGKDADAKLLEHLTTGPKVKLQDGSEEDHKMLKTKDKAEIDNLIAWLRAQAK
ncbi:c-type cytochrome [Uliginosibacterium sediminicola]|uniref:C-type cytochrome n=1 Tax=Uliginosibacterium sediminicola TaxID=2024550 RepID=A0ABU9YW24_9RHOO